MALDETRVVVLCWHSLPGPTGGRLIGVVARLNPDIPDWAAYVGIGTGDDEEEDARSIAELGAKLPEDVARAYAAGKAFGFWPYRR